MPRNNVGPENSLELERLSVLWQRMCSDWEMTNHHILRLREDTKYTAFDTDCSCRVEFRVAKQLFETWAVPLEGEIEILWYTMDSGLQRDAVRVAGTCYSEGL